MSFLQPHHIVDLYVWVDEVLPERKKNPEKGGRPQILSDAELVTLLIWNTLVVRQKTMKDLYHFTRLHM